MDILHAPRPFAKASCPDEDNQLYLYSGLIQVVDRALDPVAQIQCVTLH